MKDERPDEAGPRRTVLVAEDDPRMLTMLVEVLEAYDFCVVSASDGETAVRQAQIHRPDVICLDLGLPVMDGLTAAIALQSDPRTQRIPIVAVTGWEMTRETAGGIALFCAAYVPKPFEIQRFLRLLDCVVRCRPPQQRSGHPDEASDGNT